MTLIITCALLVGGMFGAAIGHLLKPRKEISPRTRDLLNDMAQAISNAGITWDHDEPNILNNETKESFRALLQRYHKEINK